LVPQHDVPVEKERINKPSKPVGVENCSIMHKVAKKHALRPVQLRDFYPKSSIMHQLVQLQQRRSLQTVAEVT